MIAEYAQILDDLPPIVVFFDKETGTYWLADGYHRVKAAKSLGREDILAEIREGTLEDAYRHASTANQGRGLRDRNKDKRARVASTIKDFPGRSNRWIAEVASVHHDTVDRIRPASELAETASSTRVGKDGKSRPATQPKTPKPGPATPIVPADAPLTSAQWPVMGRESTDKIDRQVREAIARCVNVLVYYHLSSRPGDARGGGFPRRGGPRDPRPRRGRDSGPLRPRGRALARRPPARRLCPDQVPSWRRAGGDLRRSA